MKKEDQEKRDLLLQKLGSPEVLYVASGNEFFLSTVARNLDLIVEGINPDADGFSEPEAPLEACTWKLSGIGAERVGLASDVGVEFSGEEKIQVKPKRDPECEIINLETGVPQKIVDRFSKKNGVYTKWISCVGIKFDDGSMCLTEINIEAHVPKLTLEQIKKYYSEDSSAGLLLVKLIKDLFPDLIYIASNSLGDEIVQIDHQTAWDLIVNKTPSIDILSQLVSSEAELVEVGESEIGLVTLSLLRILDHDYEEFPNIISGETLRDGTPVTVEFMAIKDVDEVMNLVYKNFDESPSYDQENPEVVDVYKNANSPKEIARAKMSPANTASIVMREDGTNKIIGYAMVKNGKFKEDGTPILTIKRLHAHLDWQGGQGVGSALIRSLEKTIKETYLRKVVVEVGASGTSENFYKKSGFEEDFRGINPALASQGVEAKSYVKMNKVIN
jgi:predicted N-acetyltransferase YhbS